MDKQQLHKLGRHLKESMMTTTANFDAFSSDLRKKLKGGNEVVVSIRQLGQNVFEYKFSAKSPLKEEAIAVKPASEVWADNKDDAKTYIANTVYFVRKLDGGTKYEITIEDGTERKSFATMTRVELDKAFTPVRAKQVPDAEGYVQYRNLDEIEAFKYTDDTVKVEDADSGMKSLLGKGDYLLKKPQGDYFVYEVKKAKDFETNYSAK
jgi:hypothetical protein